MAQQAGREPFHLVSESGQEITLPHTLPDDTVVTSLDTEYMVEETARSLRWVEPGAYGLRIIADCDRKELPQ